MLVPLTTTGLGQCAPCAVSPYFSRPDSYHCNRRSSGDVMAALGGCSLLHILEPGHSFRQALSLNYCSAGRVAMPNDRIGTWVMPRLTLVFGILEMKRVTWCRLTAGACEGSRYQGDDHVGDHSS